MKLIDKESDIHPHITISTEDLLRITDEMEQAREKMGTLAITVPLYHFPPIEEVIFNEPGKATIIRWNDGVKTIVRCGDGETFDRYTGFMAAVCKRLFNGTTTAKKLMNAKDRKYQASLRAAKEEKEKAKKAAEAKEAAQRAAKRRAKEDQESFDAMVEFMLRKMRAEEVSKGIMAGNLPFDDSTEVECHEE